MSALGQPAWGSLSLCLMESAVGEWWTSSRDGSNLLSLPGQCPWDDDDEPLGLEGIKPKSSPIPRRRSSLSSCSDDDSQPPPSSSRRVSFADAFGLSLVSVKQFDSWTASCPSDPLEGDQKEAREYFLSQRFTLPSTPEELIQKVQEQKLELESLELLPGTTTLKGIIRVLNVCFDKLVFVRTSLDCWASHFDLLAEYIPGSSDGDMDCFSFRLTLVPPFGEQGARVDFCFRYETPLGTFWANNRGQNFVLFCHEKAKGQSENVTNKIKSCLKSTSRDSETSSSSSTEEIPEIILNCEPAAEPVGVNEEKIKDERINLEEENIRNHSRRSRRKAARLAKVQQYFAEREEKDHQQIEKETSDSAMKASVGEPVPEIVEAPLNFSTTQTNVVMEMPDKVPSSSTEPEKVQQKCHSASVDGDNKDDLTACIEEPEKEDLPVIQSELTTSQASLSPKDSVNCNKYTANSVSQALDNSQNKETVTGQTASITQQLPECQNLEPSNSKTLEKAWECFEKGAIEKTGSTTDKIMGENTNSSENNPDIQAFSHNFTFETIVAPLYHEVFERMETQRRDLVNKEFSVGRSFGKLEDGCLRAVTYQSYPRTQSMESRSNACKCEKHVVSDVYHGARNEPFPPDSCNMMKTNESPLCDSTVNREFAMKGAKLHNSPTNIVEDTLDANISVSEMAQMVTCEQKQHSANSLSFQLECLKRTCSLEECTLQAEQQQHGVLLLDSASEDIDYTTLYNIPSQSECSPENSQNEHTSVDYMVLTTQVDIDYTTAVPYTTPISLGISTENSKIQNKEDKILQTQPAEGRQTAEELSYSETPSNNRCLEESHSDSSLFYTYISSNVTPNFSQSGASTLSQSLTSVANIQTQSPDVTAFKQGQKAAGTTRVQTTERANVIQDSDTMTHCIDDASTRVNSEMISTSEKNHETDDSEGMETERNETAQTEKSCTNSGQTDERVSTSNNLHHSSKALDQVSSKDPLNSASLGKEADVYEENQQTENTDMHEEQKPKDVREHQLMHIEEPEVEQQQEQEQEELEEGQQQVEQETGDNSDAADELQLEERGGGDIDEVIELGNEDSFEDELMFIDDEDEEEFERKEKCAEQNMKTWEDEGDLLSLEVETGDQLMVVATVKSSTNVDLQDKQGTGNGSEQGCSISGEEENLLQRASTILNDIEDIICQVEKHQPREVTADVNNLPGNREDVSEQNVRNTDESASTESVTDDEMELYLHRLKNTQQSGFGDTVSNGNYSKRPSVSRMITMPSISESVDEDQPNVSLEDVSHEIVEAEKATLPVVDDEDEVRRRNVLWWKEFFSSDNMSKMFGYTMLMVVFLITACYYDFVACFGLYLLALYWLYFRGQSESFKAMQPER